MQCCRLGLERISGRAPTVSALVSAGIFPKSLLIRVASDTIDVN